jgi:hypothetical protein
MHGLNLLEKTIAGKRARGKEESSIAQENNGWL